VAGRGALLPRLEEERGKGEVSGGRKYLGKVGPKRVRYMWRRLRVIRVPDALTRISQYKIG
jgi:hypothetical protein